MGESCSMKSIGQPFCNQDQIINNSKHNKGICDIDENDMDMLRVRYRLMCMYK